MFFFFSSLNTWIISLDFSKRKSIVLLLISFISLDLKIYLFPWILGLYLTISSILFVIKPFYSIILDYSNSLPGVLILLSFRNFRDNFISAISFDIMNCMLNLSLSYTITRKILSKSWSISYGGSFFRSYSRSSVKYILFLNFLYPGY
jgi:hypothetical protein